MIEQGTVLRYDPRRGYGFIRADAGGADLFMHANDLPRARSVERGRFTAEANDFNLDGGVRVEFKRVDGPKGPRAQNVRIIRAERGDPIVAITDFDFGLK